MGFDRNLLEINAIRIFVSHQIYRLFLSVITRYTVSFLQTKTVCTVAPSGATIFHRLCSLYVLKVQERSQCEVDES